MLIDNGILISVAAPLLSLAVGFWLGLALRRHRYPFVGPSLNPPAFATVKEQAAVAAQGAKEHATSTLNSAPADHSNSKYLDDATERLRQISNECREMDRTRSRSFDTNELNQLIDEHLQSHHEIQTRLKETEHRLAQQYIRVDGYIKEARTDDLTGLPNRREFQRKLQRKFDAFQNGDKPFVISILDVDHFKHINDQYGHSVGDTVLKSIAEQLKTHLNSNSFAARFGGEEFAIIHDHPLPEASQEMERLRRQIENKILAGLNPPDQVTISVGLSEVSNETSINLLVQRADTAMYAAKRAGRNQVRNHNGSLSFLQPETP